MPQLWQLLTTLNVNTVLGVTRSLTAIVQGSSTLPIPEPSPDDFLGKMLELGAKLQEEFEPQKCAMNLSMWEIIRSYFFLLHESINLATRKTELSWLAYLLDNQTLCALIKHFLVACNEGNLLGPKAIHFYAQNPLVDESLGEIRALVLICVTELCRNAMLKPELKNKGLHKLRFKSLVGDVAEVVCGSLIDTASQKTPIEELHSLNEKVERVLTCQLKFLSTICSKDNLFYSIFLNYSELLFKLVIIPLMKLSSDERDKLDNDPQEFVAYSLDLIGLHRSEMPKSEALGLFEYICENVDGATTKFFSFLFGVFVETVSGQPGPVTQELQTVDKLKVFKPEDWISISMLLLADVSYLISSREDLILQVKGFALGHIDRFLSFSTTLLRVQSLIFFSQYTEFIMNSFDEKKYFQKLIAHFSHCMLDHGVPEVVSLTAVECVNIIFKEDLVSHSKNMENVMAEQVPDLVRGMMNGMQNGRDNDAFFTTFETIFK